jgi:hypothetical protein
MRPRTTSLLPWVALLGAVAVMVSALAGAPQALAASSEVKLEIAQNCHLPNWPCWNVKGNNQEDIGQIQPFTIAQDGTISFEDNDSKAPTDVIWMGAAPSCIPAVPSTPKTAWNSTCTFTNAGDYEFESQDLFNDGTFNYTKYKVVVEIPGAPVVSTGTASAINETEATLEGIVNPEGKETKYHFKYGTSPSYGEETSEASAGSGSTGKSVSTLITDLKAGTIYYYRLVATNGVGTVEGTGSTFTTSSPPGPPSATTGQASVLGETAATLTGAVDPDGQVTSYLFQWGTSDSYGHSTSELSAGSDHSSHAETAALSELTAGTVYHFRIVAKNQTETVMGADETFTTASPPPPNTPSPISSPVGGNPIAATSMSPPASSQGATSGPPVTPPTTLSTEKAAKPLTRAQKLATALKQCKKRPKKKRAQCETNARKLYAPQHKNHKK